MWKRLYADYVDCSTQLTVVCCLQHDDATADIDWSHCERCHLDIIVSSVFPLAKWPNNIFRQKLLIVNMLIMSVDGRHEFYIRNGGEGGHKANEHISWRSRDFVYLYVYGAIVSVVQKGVELSAASRFRRQKASQFRCQSIPLIFASSTKWQRHIASENWWALAI